MRKIMMSEKWIRGQIMENVSPNGHFPNLPFTEMDKSQKTFPKTNYRKDISQIIFSEWVNLNKKKKS